MGINNIDSTKHNKQLTLKQRKAIFAAIIFLDKTKKIQTFGPKIKCNNFERHYCFIYDKNLVLRYAIFIGKSAQYQG